MKDWLSSNLYQSLSKIEDPRSAKGVHYKLCDLFMHDF